MKIIMRYLLLSLNILFFFLSCKSNAVEPTSTFAEDKTFYHFVDSVSASKMIVDADVDGFFEQISEADISIQMKNPDGFESIEDARNKYKDFLRTQVSDFSETERAYMDEVFEKVQSLLKELNDDLIIPKISLVKIKLDHYGPDVYYTRGNCIMIPSNSLKRTDTKGQTNVMLHEIWHILSRNNVQLREDAYKLIGFEKHGVDLELPEPLSSRVLTNPDGTSMDYAIDLGDGIKAVPLIVSTQKIYNPNIRQFFNYLRFDLYEISDNQMLKVTPEGKTTIPAENNAKFFKMIKDNTQYIIHPDEILADNFMLAINANSSGELEKYSPEGRKLLEDLTKILKEFNR